MVCNRVGCFFIVFDKYMVVDVVGDTPVGVAYVFGDDFHIDT